VSSLPAGGQALAYALTPIRVDVITGQVHRGIAPAEGGYTQSDDKPLGKVHGYIARIDRESTLELEGAAKQQFSMAAMRWVFTRAINNDPLAIDNLP
jgi:hypothetical protein